VEVIDEFFVGAVNGDAGWKPIGLSGIDGVFLAEISIQNGIAQFGFGEGFVGAVPVSIGAWNNYSIDVNFATGTVSGFVDGVLIATGAIATGATDVGFVSFGVNNASGSTAQGFADNLSLTSGVPEPSTWAMLLAGFAGIGLLGLRRSRKPRPA
jgi:hypothetical protein